MMKSHRHESLVISILGLESVHGKLRGKRLERMEFFELQAYHRKLSSIPMRSRDYIFA